MREVPCATHHNGCNHNTDVDDGDHDDDCDVEEDEEDQGLNSLIPSSCDCWSL